MLNLFCSSPCKHLLATLPILYNLGKNSIVSLLVLVAVSVNCIAVALGFCQCESSISSKPNIGASLIQSTVIRTLTCFRLSHHADSRVHLISEVTVNMDESTPEVINS